MEWLCTPNPYVRYCVKGTEDLQLLRYIKSFGYAKDEKWWYWLTKTGYLKKAPIWMYPQKGIAAEKVNSIIMNRPKVPIDQW